MRLLSKLFLVLAAVALVPAGAMADKSMVMADTSTEKNVSLEADIVVVGGGLSGISAGLTAVQSGAKVIVFEKLPSLGGAGSYPEGSLAIGTRMQREEGKGDRTALDALGKVVDFTHWRVNATAVMALLRNSGETHEWVRDEGVAFKGLRTMFPPEQTLWTWHIYKKNGASVVKNFHRKILAGGGKIFTETPVTKLLKNKKGEIYGVEAENRVTGKKYTVKAKGGVILATGGFPANEEMIKKYIIDVQAPGMVPIKLRGPLIEGRTGDGINLALAVGAQLAPGIQTVAGNAPYVNQDPPIRQFNGADYQKQARTSLSQPFLWVNKRGERFYNESQGSSFTNVYNAMTMNGGVMYSVFDDNMRQKMVNEGPITPFNAIVVPGMPMKALDEAIAIGQKEGWLYKADTLEGLAKKIGMDPVALKETVAKVNKYAKEGNDPDFGRKPEHLFAFSDKGPYYAVEGIRAYFLTLGGIKINDKLQALDMKDNVIPGLYVTGMDMGGLYDSSYDLILEGSVSGFALTSGRMVVKYIVENRLK